MFTVNIPQGSGGEFSAACSVLNTEPVQQWAYILVIILLYVPNMKLKTLNQHMHNICTPLLMHNMG